MSLTTYDVSPQLVATGNILPSTFVSQDTTTDFAGKQATAAARTIGVSSDGTKYYPSTVQTDVNAFEAGDSIQLFGLGRICLLAVGSGGWTAGDLLESDANGSGITSTTTNHWVGAIALEAGAYGEFRHVQVVSFPHP